MRAPSLAGLVLAACIGMAAAQEMKPPHISQTQVDWAAATAELNASDAFKPAADDSGAPAPLPAGTDPLSFLNGALATRFPNISASAVPVLLPFDTAALVRDRTNNETPADAPGNYLSGFESAPFFHAGPGGYDAVITARSADMRDLGISFADRVFIHISGAGVVYDLTEPNRMTNWPVNGESSEFPGLKRMFLENYARYTFVRYGVPYVVAIECFDGPSRYRKIPCKEADKLAIRFLKSLKVVGGQPQKISENPAPSTIDRPNAISTVFTYHPPGEFMRNGAKAKTGVVDYAVYSKIRFPMADAPSFANTQFARSEGSPQNYSYPWRDNF